MGIGHRQLVSWELDVPPGMKQHRQMLPSVAFATASQALEAASSAISWMVSWLPPASQIASGERPQVNARPPTHRTESVDHSSKAERDT